MRRPAVQRGEYAYDDNDNLPTTTTPMGHVTTLGYDPVDRLTAAFWVGVAGAQWTRRPW